MFLEILNPVNYISVNTNIARVYGLDGAAYCSILLTIYAKATKKNKLIDGEFFKIDRGYIERMTTVSSSKQIEIDNKWEETGMLTINEADDNIIKLNTQIVAGLIAGKYVEFSKDLPQIVVSKSRASKKQNKFEMLKSGLKIKDEDVLIQLKMWIDAVSFSKRKSKLTPQSITIFQEDLVSYAKNNKDLMLKVVRTACSNAYIECQHAINLYEGTKNIEEQNKEQNKVKSGNYLENIAKPGDAIKKEF
jgi:hypothetical protein